MGTFQDRPSSFKNLIEICTMKVNDLGNMYQSQKHVTSVVKACVWNSWKRITVVRNVTNRWYQLRNVRLTFLERRVPTSVRRGGSRKRESVKNSLEEKKRKTTCHRELRKWISIEGDARSVVVMQTQPSWLRITRITI